jgi:GTPase SAR1 family protein
VLTFDSENDIERLISTGLSQRRSRAVSLSLPRNKDKTAYQVLVMGGSKVGKTAIIKRNILYQFLRTSKERLQEMNQWHFKSHRKNITFNIEDTGQSFASDFPAMLELSASSVHVANVVCLGYAVDVGHF